MNSEGEYYKVLPMYHEICITGFHDEYHKVLRSGL